MSIINKMKENLGIEKEEKNEQKSEVSVTCFAKGEDKYEVVSKKAVTSFKEKLDIYYIEELTINIISSEKIDDNTLDEIKNNIKKEFEYEINVIFNNLFISLDMNDEVSITLYTDIISFFDTDAPTINKIKQCNKYIKKECIDESKLLQEVKEIAKNINKEEYEICNLYLKCDITKVSIFFVEEICDIFMEENEQLNVAYNMGISNDEELTLFIGLDK